MYKFASCTYARNVKVGIPDIAKKITDNIYAFTEDGKLAILKVDKGYVASLWICPTQFIKDFYDEFNTLVPVENTGYSQLYKNIWDKIEYKPLRQLCEEYAGDKHIKRLYLGDNIAIYCYNSYGTVGSNIRIEVIYLDTGNKEDTLYCNKDAFMSIIDMVNNTN